MEDKEKKGKEGKGKQQEGESWEGPREGRAKVESSCTHTPSRLTIFRSPELPPMRGCFCLRAVVLKTPREGADSQGGNDPAFSSKVLIGLHTGHPRWGSISGAAKTLRGGRSGLGKLRKSPPGPRREEAR